MPEASRARVSQQGQARQRVRVSQRGQALARARALALVPEQVPLAE